MSDAQSRAPIRTFGRRGGRALSPRQKRLMETLLPQVAYPVDAQVEIDPKTLFDDARAVWLEIGFGGGEHLIAQARQHPQIGFVGCEPFAEGVAKALSGIETHGLSNIRLHADDARTVLQTLKPQTLERCFILFPDPWPKARHQKRRLIQPAFLTALQTAMRRGATIRFATDVKSYADEALWRFLQHGGFSWQASCADDWRCAPADHIETRYQSKQLGDCAPVFYDFLVI